MSTISFEGVWVISFIKYFISGKTQNIYSVLIKYLWSVIWALGLDSPGGKMKQAPQDILKTP